MYFLCLNTLTITKTVHLYSHALNFKISVVFQSGKYAYHSIISCYSPVCGDLPCIMQPSPSNSH